ncbi:hypothetical protein C8R47DRAFT_1220886 [Mycena vitilis]|nr:hypothetical protein C8R47DRAFT_1220886 [Mycena vitilis]
MAHPNFILNSRTLVIGGTSGVGFAVASGALANELQSIYTGAHDSGSPVDLPNADALETDLRSVLDAAVNETGGPLDHIVYTAGEDLAKAPLEE